MFFVLRETRATVLLRRKAKKLRTERGMQDGGRYTAKSEVNKQAFGEAMKRSLSRPLSESSPSARRVGGYRVDDSVFGS